MNESTNMWRLLSACVASEIIVVVMFLFTHALLQFCTLYFLNLTPNKSTTTKGIFEYFLVFCATKHCTSHNMRSHTHDMICHITERETLCCLFDKLFLLSKKKNFSSPFVSPIQHQTEQKINV